MYALIHFLEHLKNNLEFDLLISRITGLFVYVFTFAFDFSFMKANTPLLLNVNVYEELAIGVIRMMFAVISALIIFVLTDLYKRHVGKKRKED